MMTKEKDGLDAFVFGEGVELMDFKCFRGDGEDVSEADIKEQIHSAMMQKKMNRAVVSDVPPPAECSIVNVREFVKELMAA